MRVEEGAVYLVGRFFGYLAGLALSATVLFFALTFTDRLPAGWTILHPFGIIIAASGLGLLARRLLR